MAIEFARNTKNFENRWFYCYAMRTILKMFSFLLDKSWKAAGLLCENSDDIHFGGDKDSCHIL